MATSTTLALGSSLGCDLWAGVDCTNTSDTVVATTSGAALACGACAARHAEVTAPAQAGEPPF